MAAINTDGRVSVFTGPDGQPVMPQLNAAGSIATSAADGTVTAPGGNPTQVVNVQGSASGTPLPVSATGLSRIPALGQATMANSTPVTMASDQAPQTVVGRFLRVPCTQFTRPATTGTVVQGSVCGPVTTPAVMT